MTASSTQPDLWPSQKLAVKLVHEATTNGARRVCVTSPTGGGKGRIICELIRDWAVSGFSVSLYTNRKMLVRQLSKVLSEFGINHGVRASGWEDDRNCPVQISSMQTENSRVLSRKTWQLHGAQRVIVDEAHLLTTGKAREILDAHVAAGASYVGMTATPLGMKDAYDQLIVAGNMTELRKCGALVPCVHFGPTEPDCSKVRKELHAYTENDVKKVMNVQHVFGSVRQWYNTLNPERKATILFAPGVEESVWFAQQFTKAGIRAAHIDGENCWLDGKLYSSDGKAREDIIAALKANDIKIVTNRFVLREGIDVPQIEHMILATVFSSLGSYLQSVGRGLRACPSTGKKQLTLQDHGGMWWKHGSVNADRNWELTDTETVVQAKYVEGMRSKKTSEPMRCPRCSKIMLSVQCACGFQITRRTRPVIMEDGSLVNLTGEIFKQKFVRKDSNTEKLWYACYWQARNSGQTFRQAMGNFVRQHRYWPPSDLPMMPREDNKFYCKVADVPVNQLIGRQ